MASARGGGMHRDRGNAEFLARAQNRNAFAADWIRDL